MNKALKKIVKAWHDCTRCDLGYDAKSHVFFRGSCPCDVLFIGEAPGKDEDMVGQPFVGRAGDILNAMIEAANDEIKFTVEMFDSPDKGICRKNDPFTYGITNIVCCIPLTDDRKLRTPNKVEAAACSPRLVKMIEACSPKLVILLGREAAKYYKMPDSLASVPVVELQHPAHVSYNGGIGSLTYDQNLVRLVEALETHLYGEKDRPKKRKKAKHKKKSSAKEVAEALTKHFIKTGQFNSHRSSRR